MHNWCCSATIVGLIRWADYVACKAVVIISYRTLARNPGGQRELMLKIEGVRKEGGYSWLKQGTMA